jgi:hypothetical protein
VSANDSAKCRERQLEEVPHGSDDCHINGGNGPTMPRSSTRAESERSAAQQSQRASKKLEAHSSRDDAVCRPSAAVKRKPVCNRGQTIILAVVKPALGRVLRDCCYFVY